MRVIMKSSSAASIRNAQEELEKCLTLLSVSHTTRYHCAFQLSCTLQLRLQSRNASTVKELHETNQKDLETTLGAAMKRHHEEEIELIKANLTKIVSVFKSDVNFTLESY
jgi:hypothetical protein